MYPSKKYIHIALRTIFLSSKCNYFSSRCTYIQTTKNFLLILLRRIIDVKNCETRRGKKKKNQFDPLGKVCAWISVVVSAFLARRPFYASQSFALKSHGVIAAPFFHTVTTRYATQRHATRNQPCLYLTSSHPLFWCKLRIPNGLWTA